MTTRIVIDDSLFEVVYAADEIESAKDAGRKVRTEDLQKRQQLKILGLFGSIDYDANYDCKAQRLRERGISTASA